MPVITVSREYASGGSEIARRLAQRLGWELVDNEFIERVARLAGLPREEVAQHEERVTTFMERLAGTLSGTAPELFMAAPTDVAAPPSEDEIVKQCERVIAEAVRHDHVILVGRGAPACLGQREGTLHIFVVAPLAVRIARAAERLQVDPKDAERTIRELDEGRRRYVKTYYGRRWEDPTNYHLVLNSGALSFEECAEIIEAAARLRGWT
jgi:cytidylate kinase